MTAPKRQYFKPGIVHFMAYPDTMRGEGPIEETVRRIAMDEYFSAIELTWILDANARGRVRDMCETAGLTVAYGAQPRLLTTGLNINDLDESRRLRALATLMEGIDEAYELGATGFSFLSGKYDEATKRRSFEALRDSTRQLCEYAAQRGGMAVALEVFDYDIDKMSLIGPTGLALEFSEAMRVECPNFGLLVDLSHIPMLRETVEEAVLPLKGHIIHAHMGNTVIADKSLPAYGDMHPRFGFPGGENGAEQLTMYLRALLDIGYLNPDNPPVLSFEVKPWGDEDPELVIANATRTLDEAWARV